MIEANGISLYVEEHGEVRSYGLRNVAGDITGLLDRLEVPAAHVVGHAAPTLGIWSTGDHYLDGERMKASAAFVQGPWRYEEIPGASHWMPLDVPDTLNNLLLDWLS
jgi:pimeloyl-ACP methyl ester carboxylesterase